MALKNKKYVLGMGLMLFVSVLYGQNSWKEQGIKIPPTICYGSGHSHPSYIPSPLDADFRLKSASGKKAEILVTYIGFPTDAQLAFQFAVDIWKELIYSPVPIRIQAKWESLGAGVLGKCGPSEFFRNFNASQKWETYYPIALVEKMLGEAVNPDTQFEIVAQFNKDFNWYFGSDGKTPENSYDFSSTVLHELAHGFGFTGNFYTNRGRGAYAYGEDGFPAIYDQFVVNQEGAKLTNKSIFTNPSTKLYQALTSGWLEFNRKMPDNSTPRLFAPTSWDTGSSIYHLDETIYPAGNLNSLMTPYADEGEAIHHPGPNTLGILYDLGWKSISFQHEPLKDIELVTTPIELLTKITSDNELDSTKLFLVYSTNLFVKSDSVLLKAGLVPGTFSTKVTLGQNTEFCYYFAATDKEKRRFVFPSGSPSRYLNIKTGIDKEAPVVEHKIVTEMFSSHPAIKIEANVTDNIGLKSVSVDYFINGGNIRSASMVNSKDDLYSGNLSIQQGAVKGGDVVSYRVMAVDASSQSNIGRSPLSGFNKISVTGIEPPVAKYFNDFNLPKSDFLTTDFTVSMPIGFENAALNTAHPYLSPEVDNQNFNFVAVLKVPIILKSGGKMSFDEIVMVEPGEPGTNFGDEEFWDYVIVEGMKYGTNTWKPLLDGYDSNSQKSWYDKFNSSFTGQNSSAVPSKDLFVKREFELTANGNFTAGDTLLIRFRLFSDPYTNGWGWVIDNLNIQDIGTVINAVAVSPGELQLYPNPFSGRVNLRLETKKSIEILTLKVYNSLGTEILNRRINVNSNRYQEQFDWTGYAPGLYLFSIEVDGKQTITRKMVLK